jgi:hypothetical protein
MPSERNAGLHIKMSSSMHNHYFWIRTLTTQAQGIRNSIALQNQLAALCLVQSTDKSFFQLFLLSLESRLWFPKFSVQILAYQYLGIR